MNSHAPVCKSVTREQLAVLLEDTLSAATGWTVVPPRIHVLHDGSGLTNWTVDTGPMDEDLQSIVTRMQRRYRVRTAPAGWRGHLVSLLTGRRPGMVECQV